MKLRDICCIGYKSNQALFFGLAADHGRADWLGHWDEFVQKARFIKLDCLCHSKQNDLTYLGRVCTPCLSVSTGIYGLANNQMVTLAPHIPPTQSDLTFKYSMTLFFCAQGPVCLHFNFKNNYSETRL
jgi:hypothetical protein